MFRLCLPMFDWLIQVNNTAVGVLWTDTVHVGSDSCMRCVLSSFLVCLAWKSTVWSEAA